MLPNVPISKEQINEQKLLKTENISKELIFNIEEALSSKNYDTYMRGVYTIFCKGKIYGFELFSTKKIVQELLSAFEKDIMCFNYIFQDLYRMTCDDNPNRKFVKDLIKPKIYEIFKNFQIEQENYQIDGHSFKTLCKIVSNILMDDNENSLFNFINENFKKILIIFHNFYNEVKELRENDNISNGAYLCLGCLRIFSALCNQQEAIQKRFEQTVSVECIKAFLLSLDYFRNRRVAYSLIKYTYFITLWSPGEVTKLLFQKEAVMFIFTLVANTDREMKFSFYSSLILLAFAKFHIPEYAEFLSNFNPFDVDINLLYKRARTYYLLFLFNLALTGQSFAENFIQSNSIKSVIYKNPQNINEAFQTNHINYVKFTKYMSLIFLQFPSTRIFFFNLFQQDNIIMFFASALQLQKEDKTIMAILNCLDIIMEDIHKKTDIGNMLEEKLKESSEDLTSELENIKSDTMNSDICNYVSILLQKTFELLPL